MTGLKANKRLFAIRVLKKCGLSRADLTQVYCSIIRSVLEYASPVWAALPIFLSDYVESVQKRALRIIHPYLSYEDALQVSGLLSLRARREDACIRFMQRIHGCSPFKSLIPKIVHEHGYALRSGSGGILKHVPNTKRFSDFITSRLQDLIRE